MAFILPLVVVFPVIAQDYGNDTQKFTLSGEITGMYTFGLAEDDQKIVINTPPYASGVYDDENNGKNGYYTYINLNFLYNPFSFVDVYAKFQARSRPGSPYIPLQLEDADMDTFSVSIDSAYGRINAIEAFGLSIPLGIYLKAGKFDTTPSSFQNVSRYGTENVLSRVRTKNTYSFQLAVSYELPFADALNFRFTTHQKLNEAITPLYDTDGSKGYHGEPSVEELYDIPIHAALDFVNISTPVGLLSAEAVYAYNAESIYSGHNFGFSAGMGIEIPGMDNLVIPFGIGAAMYEKNIDPLAKTAVDTNSRSHLTILERNDYNSISFRRAFRMGAGVGMRLSASDTLKIEANLGYSWSQIAHYYRDTITLSSASFDALVKLNNQFFIGGGIYLGTLSDVEWKTSESTNPTMENGYLKVFTLAENLGFEIFCGMQFDKSRFLIGYNNNKGLAMNNTIEGISDAQIKYRQSGSGINDGLFEYGGVFAKLVVSW